jgi:uncharacterized protein
MNPTLKKLYARVPSFECIPGCTDCCGIVPWTQEEWNAIKDKRKHDSLKCPYASKSGCEIYNQRPFLCRAFGTVDHPLMKCPHGCGPKKRLSVKTGQQLMDQYHELMGEKLCFPGK